jgi:hypothetical protein
MYRELRRVCHHLHRELQQYAPQRINALIASIVFYRLVNPRLIMERPTIEPKLWRRVVVAVNSVVMALCDPAGDPSTPPVSAQAHSPTAAQETRAQIEALHTESNRQLLHAVLQQLVALESGGRAHAVRPTTTATAAAVNQPVEYLLQLVRSCDEHHLLNEQESSAEATHA